jgi:hypothetical protein
VIESDRYKERAQNLAALTIKAVLAQKPHRIDLAVIAAKIITTIRGQRVAL